MEEENAIKSKRTKKDISTREKNPLGGRDHKKRPKLNTAGLKIQYNQSGQPKPFHDPIRKTPTCKSLSMKFQISCQEQQKDHGRSSAPTARPTNTDPTNGPARTVPEVGQNLGDAAGDHDQGAEALEPRQQGLGAQEQHGPGEQHQEQAGAEHLGLAAARKPVPVGGWVCVAW